MSRTLDAVIFDWGGTLTPWHDLDLTQAWTAYAGAHDPAHGPEVAAALLAAEAQAWQRSQIDHTSTSFLDIVTAAGLDATGPAHARGLAAYLDWFTPHTYTDPDVPDLLRALRDRGLRIGVLSNTTWPRDAHEEVFARDGVLDLIDGAVFTSEIAWTKPHHQAFDAARRAIGAPDAARCVFVGDRPFDDIFGAAAAGMRTILVPHSAIPPHERGHTVGDPDAVVGRLADVLGIVDGWLGA